MPRGPLPRGSNPCFNCRRKRRLCSKERPACLACRNVRACCTYPDETSVSGFVTLESPGYFLSPIQRPVTSSAFLHLTADEFSAIERTLESPVAYDNTKCGSVDHSRFIENAWWNGLNRDCESQKGPPISLICPSRQFDLGRGPQLLGAIEGYLIQYYDNVISTSWVYDPADVNMFRSAVMPRLLQTSGPLLLTVMALSASELYRSSPEVSMNYNQLSLSYKGRALKGLQSCLHVPQFAENNLLTCVLLSSLGIAAGEETWIQHSKGAFALISSFNSTMDPSIVDFGLQYYHTRSTLATTARSHHPRDSSNSVLQSLLLEPAIQSRLETRVIDPYIGCPASLLRVIDEISQLSSRIDMDYDANAPRQHFEANAQILKDRIRSMSFSDLNCYGDGLRIIVEAFQLATSLYLQMTCFKTSIEASFLIEDLNSLISLLSRIVTHLERRLFPMWPLFIAGCACSTDEQRIVILELFAKLDSQWPTRNIATVSRALWTIWQVRDHTPHPELPRTQNWQRILDQFGWRLSLA